MEEKTTTLRTFFGNSGKILIGYTGQKLKMGIGCRKLELDRAFMF